MYFREWRKNIVFVFRTYQSKVSKQISQQPSSVRPLSSHCTRIRQILSTYSLKHKRHFHYFNIFTIFFLVSLFWKISGTNHAQLFTEPALLQKSDLGWVLSKQSKGCSWAPGCKQNKTKRAKKWVLTKSTKIRGPLAANLLECGENPVASANC